MSYYKLHKYLETVQDAERALELEPESCKLTANEGFLRIKNMSF